MKRKKIFAIMILLMFQISPLSAQDDDDLEDSSSPIENCIGEDCADSEGIPQDVINEEDVEGLEMKKPSLDSAKSAGSEEAEEHTEIQITPATDVAPKSTPTTVAKEKKWWQFWK